MGCTRATRHSTRGYGTKHGQALMVGRLLKNSCRASIASLLLRRFSPTHAAARGATVVRQHNGAHGAQRLFRGHVQRDTLFNRISDVGIKSAIISALRLYFLPCFPRDAQGPPLLLRFFSPVCAPLLARVKPPR